MSLGNNAESERVAKWEQVKDTSRMNLEVILYLKSILFRALHAYKNNEEYQIERD